MKQPIDTSDEQPEHQSVFHRGKPIDAPQDLEAKPMPRASAWKWIWYIPAGLLLAPALIIFLFRWVNPPTSAFILQDQFEVLISRSGAKVEHRWVDLAQISRKVQLAVIAAEDQKFPQHFGFDVAAIEDALDHNTKKKSTRGASTISQQVAKNLFLSSSRNWLRKGLEAYLTLWIEMLWPKERILEVYLNIAQFDDHIFGVGIASQQLFGTKAAHLSSDQAALLAAVLPNPSRYSAARPTFYVSQRAGWIQRQMRQLGDDYLDRL